MRHFYGYQRQPKDAPEGCDKLWLDFPETDRQERVAMIERGLRPDDVVVVLAPGDLGRGREAKALREKIEAMGCSVEVHTPPVMPDRRGRPAIFSPTEDQDQRIERLYRSPAQMSHVLARASEIMGWPVKRHHLVRRYGKRWA